MLFINLKTYPLGTGEHAKNFAIEAQKIHEQTNVPITIVAQAVDIRMLAQSTTLPIWAQHIDNINPGKNTGFTLPDAVMEAGATGAMINHSENQMSNNDIHEIVKKFQNDKFQILLSTRTPEYAQDFDTLGPAYLSYEPSMYIGAKSTIIDISPLLVSSLAQKLKSPFVIGAGIHKPEHIIKGFQLGAKGFIISSDILTNDQPIERLKEYVNAYVSAFTNPRV